MAPPIIKFGKKKVLPVPNEEEDDDDSVPTPVKPSLLPAVVRRKAPLLIIPEALSDEEVEQEIEQAKERPSSFGYSIPNIRNHMNNKDYNSASMATKEALLTTLIELVPLAERSLRESGASKGIYQFNSLIGQVRELLVDLDGERDLANTMQGILDEAIRPVFMMLTQMVIMFSNSLKRQIRAELNENDCKVVYGLVDEQIKELGTYIQGMFLEVQRRVDKKLEA